jgi:hypothetical protein
MKKLIIILILSLSIKSYSQWTQVSTPTTENLIDIYFKEENIGFCIAENGIILKTIDAGNNWSIIQQNANINYTNIVFYNNKLVSFGVENGIKKYFYSFDEGITWVSENTTLIPISLSLLNNDLFYTDFNTLNLYKFNDNQPIVIASDVGIFGVNNLTNELIYVNYLYNIIRKSIDYGQNWQELQTFPNGFSQNQSTNAVIKPFNNKVIIHHTYPNHTIFSNDNGITWTINTDDVDTGFTKIINETTIYSIRTNNIAITQNLINWQSLLEDSNQKRNIYFINDNLGFILGNNGLLYRTENGGLSINSNQILEKKIKIYPNPVKNNIKIEFTDIIIKKIDLININGKLIKSYNSNFTELKICNVSKGSYILKIETEKGILNKKILVE